MTTLTIDVRTANLSDAGGISHVHEASWKNAYSGIIPSQVLLQMLQRRDVQWWQTALRRHVDILVIEAGNKIVGYATMGNNRVQSLPYDAEIYEIYLLPEYQGLGFGARLFSSALKILRSRGKRKVIVWALSENDRADKFYKNFGGVPVAAGFEAFGDKQLEKTAYAWS